MSENRPQYRLPGITLLAIMVEITIIVIVALVATRNYANDDPSQTVNGLDAQYLTNSTYYATQIWHEFGYIPLWQPYMALGEPTVDNPFSFVLNPLSTGPSLLTDGITGLKISVILAAILAGIGGWLLGRVLGFGSLARLLLGLLCVGKGDMHAMISSGVFQLGVSQAYIPWVTAAGIATLRFPRQRWSVVLLAISFTLLFWAGNIYYTLPCLIMLILLTLSHAFYVRKDENDERRRLSLANLKIDLTPIRRMMVAGLFIVGLSAATFLPIFINQKYIGGHPDEIGAGLYSDPGAVILQYFTASVVPNTSGAETDYYSFIIPLWFAVLVFIIIPPVRWLHKSANPGQDWRVWLVGMVIIVFFTAWGAGINPIVAWLYENVPLIAQWRFVFRMLAFSSFWLGILVAMRVDGLWRAFKFWMQTRPSMQNPNLARVFSLLTAVRTPVLVVLVPVTLLAGWQVNETWQKFPAMQTLDYGGAACLGWLRQQFPTGELSVITSGSSNVTTFLQYKVRHTLLTGDYRPLAITPTLFKGDLRNFVPEFLMPIVDNERAYGNENSYIPMSGSPEFGKGNACMWQKSDAMPYAFSIPLESLQASTATITRSQVTAIDSTEQHADRIALQATGDASEPLVVVVQQVAYPGWTVTIDNKPAKLESVGQLIGVVLPADATPHYVFFQYIPPWFMIGGVLTVLAAVLASLYLLAADRFVKPYSFPKIPLISKLKSALLKEIAP